MEGKGDRGDSFTEVRISNHQIIWLGPTTLHRRDDTFFEDSHLILEDGFSPVPPRVVGLSEWTGPTPLSVRLTT